MALSDRLLAITGIIPPFVLLWYAERFERRVREPTQGWRYRIVAAAGCAAVPIAWIERFFGHGSDKFAQPWALLFDAFINAGLVEESGKFACIVLLTRGALAPRTRYGAMLYALHASMGFALVENVLAMLKVPDLATFSARFFLRAYMTVPMHLCAGGVLGYLWARRKFDVARYGPLTGLCLAVLLHGCFNASLLALEILEPEAQAERLLCAAIALVIPIGGVLVLRLLAGVLRGRDRAEEAQRRARAPERTAIEARR